MLELVRDLEEMFPMNVVALLGNHDLYALLDATLTQDSDRPMGRPVAEYTYAFAHPQVLEGNPPPSPKQIPFSKSV